MDAVRIQIIRGCDAQGQGGTIADDASGVLADGILDQVVAAFEGGFGLYSWANPAFDPEQEESDQNQRNLTVSPLRNVSTRLRLHAEEVVKAYVTRQIDAQATSQKDTLVAQLLASQTIVENAQ